MPRGHLYEEDYKLKLAGHETFLLHYGWLKKPFEAMAEGERRGIEGSVFLASNVIAIFGIDRNMVRSMRHWATVERVIADDGCKIKQQSAIEPVSSFVWSQGKTPTNQQRPESVAAIKNKHMRQVEPMRSKQQVKPLYPDDEPINIDDLNGKDKVYHACHK